MCFPLLRWLTFASSHIRGTTAAGKSPTFLTRRSTILCPMDVGRLIERSRNTWKTFHFTDAATPGRQTMFPQLHMIDSKMVGQGEYS